MSDGTSTEGQKPTGNEKYVSQIDDLFALAYNSVHNPEEPAKAGEGGDQGATAGEGAASGTADGEGAGAGEGDAAAQSAGAIPNADDLAAGKDGSGDGSSATGVEGSVAGGQAAGDKSDAGAIAGEGLDPATVTPLFAPARQEAFKRMEQSFRTAAINELQDEVNPEFIDALGVQPGQLVGNELPSIRIGAPKEEKFKPLDRQQAKQYQDDLREMIESQVQARAQEKSEELRPMATVIQESFLLFENNPDLIKGTKGYDAELATRFAEIAQSYEVKVGGRVIGYQDINVQPLINSLRADLAKQRGANGANAANARAEQQRQAAAQQERDDAGKFQGPQGGILSKAGNSGEAADDYSAFWAASSVPNGGTLGI